VEARRRAGQALARPHAFSFALAVALAFTCAFTSTAEAHDEPERERLGCAGDGAPPGSGWPRRYLSLTGLISGQVLFWAGKDLNVYLGNPVDGDGFQFRLARAGLCGRIPIKLGTLSYDVVYEPWSELERRRIDANEWGSFAWLDVGWQPLDWLGVYVGIRKVWADFATVEPEQQRELPWLPQLTLGVAPDRRLGLTADLDFGTVRAVGGVYESARNLQDVPNGGILVAARALVNPIGPVGLALSTLDDEPFWRRRARFGIDLSFLYEWTPNGSGWAVTGDAPFKYGPLGFVVEYLYASTMPEQRPSFQPAPRTSRQGLFAQAAVLVWRPWVELEARYEWSSRPITDDPRGSFHGLTGGVTVYAWRTLIKVQAAYSHRFYVDGLQPDDDLGLLVLTLAR
jgi:hypothetical protein